MVTQPIANIDRPPPDHYRARLGTVLGLLPAVDLTVTSSWESPSVPRRTIVTGRRRRSGQLALPLEAVRG